MVLRKRGGVDGLILDSALPMAGKSATRMAGNRRRINLPYGVADKLAGAGRNY